MTVSHDDNDRLVGVLLGTALGDALGLPVEGMSPQSIRRRFGRIDRFRLLGRTGFVSDDTEQSALLAQALARHPAELDHCVQAFRKSLLGWFWRLPWGIGRATLRSCLRITLGLSPSGVHSAGNGAAMRAAILGAFFHDQPEARQAWGRAIAEVTHRDDRAIEGALYVSEMAAACMSSPSGLSPFPCQEKARQVVCNSQLGSALDQARDLAMKGASTSEAAQTIGTSGFVVHTASFATFAFLRFGGDPLLALTESVNAGGDTDSIGAIVGAWLGSLHGASLLPSDLLDRIHDGPFGPTHLRALGAALSQTREGKPGPVPGFSWAAAMARNLALYPIILGHAIRRLVPL
jgi:ADP-ribosyl-[dinitrogen reductase] hydrolase